MTQIMDLYVGDYVHTKMVETYLAKTKGLNYNLSESYYAYNKKEPSMVLENDFPNKLFSQIPNISERAKSVKEKEVVTDFKYLEGRIEDEELIKRYIMQYGSVKAIIECDKQMDYYKGGIFRSSEITEYSRGPHSIVIIGWDDNYLRNNFVYEKPEHDGAWLVLNSWGTNWGNNGTALVSYEDFEIMSHTLLIGKLTLNTGEMITTELPETALEKKERLKKEEQDKKLQEEKNKRQQEQQEQQAQVEKQIKKQNMMFAVVVGIIFTSFVTMLVCSKKARKILKVFIKIIAILLLMLFCIGAVFMILALFVT